MSRSQKAIVVVGSINIDLVSKAERIPVSGETVLATEFKTHLGGKGANQAVAIFGGVETNQQISWFTPNETEAAYAGGNRKEQMRGTSGMKEVTTI